MNKFNIAASILFLQMPAAFVVAGDYLSIEDVNKFFESQPYRIVALEHSTMFTGEFSEHFLPVAIDYCSADTKNATNMLLKSSIQLGRNVVFAFVPVADDSICAIVNAGGEKILLNFINDKLAPNKDSASRLEFNIHQYGLSVQEYNRLIASRPDPGGVTQLILSLGLTALGVYGLFDPDDLTKVAGAIAIGVSTIGVVSSIKQIKKDNVREHHIHELSLQLKLNF